jgi:hypothetical protein
MNSIVLSNREVFDDFLHGHEVEASVQTSSDHLADFDVNQIVEVWYKADVPEFDHEMGRVVANLGSAETNKSLQELTIKIRILQ